MRWQDPVIWFRLCELQSANVERPEAICAVDWKSKYTAKTRDFLTEKRCAPASFDEFPILFIFSSNTLSPPVDFHVRSARYRVPAAGTGR